MTNVECKCTQCDCYGLITNLRSSQPKGSCAVTSYTEVEVTEHICCHKDISSNYNTYQFEHSPYKEFCVEIGKFLRCYLAS